MNNPAQYLLQLFEAAERDNGQTFTARDSSAAMAEIERQAAMLEAGGDSAMPMIRRAFPEYGKRYSGHSCACRTTISMQAASRTSKYCRLARK